MEIYKKIFEAKKEFTAISKDQKNPHFQSAYYDINDLLKMVEPVLHSKGLMIMQPIKDGKISTIIIDVDTGETLEAYYQLDHNPNPQKVGSEITYYRRYLLSSLLSLQADDDDGNKASEKKPEDTKQWLNEQTKEWDAVMKAIEDGKVKDLAIVKSKYKLSKAVAKVLTEYIKEVSTQH